MNKSLGIYIHIPFCIKKCNYCDFCSFTDKQGAERALYVDALVRSIKKQAPLAAEYTVDTVYFGGGTPSLLSAEQIFCLLNTLSDSFSLSPSAEITLECNPATADREYFTALRSLGVNRLSIGMQSAVDRELELLGRAHLSRDFLACFGDARAAGFDNVSVDLMYGIPEQTDASLLTSLALIASIAPEHVSAYGLSVEEGTDFFRRRASLRLADDDAQANMYLTVCDKLHTAGYEKYEISNFSLPDRQSRHNLRYWRSMEYMGFGVAAHSYFGGERYGNSRDICAFLDGKDIVCERERINAEERRREYIMLGLRLTEGISAQEYEGLFCRDLQKDVRAEKFISAGLMRLCDGHLSFTDRGMLLSNYLLSELIDPPQ